MYRLNYKSIYKNKGGDIAIRYGYQRFDVKIMIITILIMIVLVQAFQFFGDKLAKWYAHTTHE